MQNIKVDFNSDEEIIIKGFPEAEKQILLKNKISKRLADFALHKCDLEFALDCLKGINQFSKEPNNLRIGLWRSAIIHYCKCFGDNHGRNNRLVSKNLFIGKSNEMEDHEYFDSLRNKTIVHDENTYTQSIPFAVLNHENSEQKIEELV